MVEYISEEPIDPTAAQMLAKAMRRLGISELRPEDIEAVEKRIGTRRFMRITGRPVEDFVGFVHWRR